MHSFEHEFVKCRVVEEIKRQLSSIASGQNHSAEFAKQVITEASVSLKFPDSPLDKHDPDERFGHYLAQWPAVILEVSFSQKKKDLSRLADAYILGSDGDIRVLIGLDIEYRGTKKATLSIWRPRSVTNDAGEEELVAMQTVTDEIIRDENGTPNDSAEAGLHLQLEDFGPEGMAQPPGSLSDPIHIPAAALCSYIEHAEKRSTMVTEGKGIRGTPKTWVRKRRRKSTPTEELDERREKKFRVSEERKMGQAEKDDSSYKASASEAESSPGS